MTTPKLRLPVRRLRFAAEGAIDTLVDREWIVTNGRGGYASGSIAGVPTRRFHGLLVAALPAPVGRALMLSELAETVRIPNTKPVLLGGYEQNERPLDLDVAAALRELRLEGGLPVWRFEVAGFVLEKRVFLVHMQNTVVVEYCLVDGPAASLRLDLRPFVSFRPHEGRVSGPKEDDYRVESNGFEHEIVGPEDLPALRLVVGEATLVREPESHHDVSFRVERARGYDWLGSTWSPGRFEIEITKGHPATLIGSTETWDAIRAISPSEAKAFERLRRARLLATADRRGVTQATEGEPQQARHADELVLAADAFVIRPASRAGDAIRALASGDELRSVIAGYHWFTDWGRDTMISLEGLTLVTGRHAEAGFILRTFARYVKDGLIPNMFPEGETAGLYHTADATLWFFHALDRYLRVTGDRLTLTTLLPTLRSIIDAHLAGTRFGIRVDARDGLLTQGEEGYQLTWMDAKVDGWVVTPRRGKAVEINALYYNALRLLAGWLREEDSDLSARPIEDAAARAHDSFNRRFWYEQGNYLYDVIDGPKESPLDPALRPNQLFAIALTHPILDQTRWARVVEVAEKELVTPVGLRSLGRAHPSYCPRYDGDLRARDAAYHQGTVWSWLIGPFIDAWLRVHPGRERDARRFLDGFGPHLDEGCVGTISEIFDAEAPYAPRGCVAQAWGVAEVLRCLEKTRTR